MTAPRTSRHTTGALAGVAIVAMAAASTRAQQQPYVTFSTVATNPYFAGDINSCAVGINNLVTVDGYQFAAYYDTTRRIRISRRAVGSSAWQTFGTGLPAISSADITDDHNVIAMAVDSDGYMHLSWDMHNVTLNYAISSAPVTGGTLGSLAFTTQTPTNAPTLFPAGGATTNEVTYPQFYDIPNSYNLLFAYRNGGAGGGSGNGDQYFNVYNPSTRSWTNTLVIDGEQTSVNAYLNTLAYTSANNLLMSWTWRASPAWQSNSNILFAQSPDNGTTWYKQGGTTPYTLPIIHSGSPATSVAQVIKAIPQNSSFINQTSMTVDAGDNPLIATWWAPGWDPSTNSGNPNRQYMLVYYDGTQWRTSQITNRTSDTAIDTSSADVRDLGRPIVLVDKQGRVLVVTRSEDTGMGSFSNAATPDNDIVVYYNTVAGLHDATPAPWRSVTLDMANMGSWEPTYDPAMWAAQNTLSLFYEPVGLGGQATGTLKVLDWDEQAYFANLSLSQWNRGTGGDWDTPANWSDGVPNAVGAVANFGAGTIAPTADSVITLSGTKVVGTITFDSPTYRYTLAAAAGGGGSLSLNNGTGTAASISVNSGSHTIAVPISLDTNAGVIISTTSGASLTFSGDVGGTGGIAKTGNGTLVLAGANTYGGTTTLSSGTLRFVGPGALSPNTNLSVTGGTLELTGDLTRPLGTAAGQIQLPSGTGGFSAGGTDVTVTIQNGSSPLVWGSPAFNPSALSFDSATSVGSVTLANDIDLNGAARAVHVNAAAATLSGILSGATGSLQLTGPGTLVLSHANTYGGGTTLSPGVQGPAVVRATASNALGTGTINTGPVGNGTTARLELAGGVTLPNAVTFPGRTNPSASIENVAGDNTLAGALTLNVGGNQYLVQSDSGTLTLSGSAGDGVAVTSAASGSRTLTLQGAGDGAIRGTIQNGNATLAITKAGAGTWTLAGTNTYTGATAVTGGTLVLSGPDAWNPALTAPAGTDIQSGRLVFDYAGHTTPQESVLAALASGQIHSTAADARHTLGWSDNGTSRVTVMYTLYGDANLDGEVNADDYALIDRAFAQHVTNARWTGGDFNYDGVVEASDYLLIDTTLGQAQGFTPAFLARRESQFGAAYVRELLTSVPEPSSPACLFATLLPRRRPRHSFARTSPDPT